ncbi:MAG: nucleotidyltransferase domain-containing protein [Defluviitaleaceae bacterium]|nr:nucleotidyltransferase domain-containing protein [Defluviitaleaceae bacterium]
MYKFLDKHNLGKPFYYIHPYKQLAVKHLVDNVEDWVEGVIIFGSSVTYAHHYDSDLDVCIIGTPKKEFSSRNLRLKGEPYDFILVDSAKLLKQKSDEDFSCVYRDIMEEGVVVYDKKNNSI